MKVFLIRFTIPLLALAFSQLADAQIASPFSFVPSQPREGDFIRLRVESPGTCASIVGSGTADLPSRVVAVTYSVGDTCDENDLGQSAPFRLFDIGPLPTGSYSVVVSSCANTPPGVPPCAVVATGILSVFGTHGTRITVPALSMVPALALILMALAFGLRAEHRK